MFTKKQLNVIAFCAEECARQESGENSVYNMISAWSLASDALDFQEEISEGFIRELGYYVEPTKNTAGYRHVPVTIRGILKDNQSLINRQMEMLVAAQSNLTPEEFYKEFEEIHPFEDGNGRVGVILYNFLKKTLEVPFYAPDFWRESQQEQIDGFPAHGWDRISK